MSSSISTESESAWAVPSVSGRKAAPLREQAAEVLRNAILTMSIPEGARLVERELIERLQVSRTTVREVLRELESEGLVDVIPQRGAVVATISPQDAADLYDARIAIEGLIVERFIERADEAAFRDLDAVTTQYERLAAADAPVTELLVMKDNFYTVLGEGAQSPALWQLLSSLQARIRVLRAHSLAEVGRPSESARELKELVAAIIDRDVETARRLCSTHVQAAATTGLPVLEKSRHS